MRLLMYMAARAGDIISIQEILDGVWSEVIVSAESVYQAIATLRRALGDKPSDDTVHRRGAVDPSHGLPLAAALDT